VLDFKAGCRDYCEGEIKEIEWQGGQVYLCRGAPPRRPGATLQTAQLGDPRLVKATRARPDVPQGAADAASRALLCGCSTPTMTWRLRKGGVRVRWVLGEVAGDVAERELAQD